MASHELGDLLGKSETFQKLLTHPLMASSTQHLSGGKKAMAPTYFGEEGISLSSVD